jgi:alpha-glucuronidase
MRTRLVVCILVMLMSGTSFGEYKGYNLWLDYTLLPDSYRNNALPYCLAVYCATPSVTLTVARKELSTAVGKLLGQKPNYCNGIVTIDSNNWEQLSEDVANGIIIAGTPQSIPALSRWIKATPPNSIESQGFIIKSLFQKGKHITIIASQSDIGVLYGVFHFIRLLQTERGIADLDVHEVPKLRYRMLNHWDNQNGTIERGYAGYSIWGWERLPYYIDSRLIDYARANASIGINGTVLNNVNASASILRTEWLVKVAKIADTFRPYGIHVFLSAKFSAPKEIGGLSSSDPKDPQVAKWWKEKVKEIYQLIPDFGGFLVKANSEGQPGPQDYGSTHADGANMLADALAPYGGKVFWRAFVYQNNRHVDRVVTGYREFKPLDGQFHSNVSVQVKYGPIDFQPREPFHPLFGQMPATNLSLETEITQENLGHAGHLVYLGKLWQEILQSDTYTEGKGTTVSKILQEYERKTGLSAMAGVSNIGSDLNWTGHPFGQANWYAFGRLCWNPDASSEDIAENWIRMTMGNDSNLVTTVKKMMMMSHEACVNYEMPLGLNHIMNFNTHNGPEPWHNDPVWTAFDYHRVSQDSIGVNRTSTGSDATSQYAKPVGKSFSDLKTCPDKFLLWFHRLPWSYRMRSGYTLWDEIVYHYYLGVDQVREMQILWRNLKDKVDNQLFDDVTALLRLQELEAEWWRDACVLFFQKYSHLPLPAGCKKPKHNLNYYEHIPYPYNWDSTKLLRQ